MIKECGQVRESEKSARTLLAEKAATGERSHFFQSPVRLVHKTAGYEIAGSAMRLTTDSYGVLYAMHNAGQGRWFKNLEEAQSYFNQITA